MVMKMTMNYAAAVAAVDDDDDGSMLWCDNVSALLLAGLAHLLDILANRPSSPLSLSSTYYLGHHQCYHCIIFYQTKKGLYQLLHSKSGQACIITRNTQEIMHYHIITASEKESHNSSNCQQIPKLIQTNKKHTYYITIARIANAVLCHSLFDKGTNKC